MLLGELRDKGVVCIALIVFTLCQLPLHLIEVLLHAYMVGEGLSGLIAHSGVVLYGHHLGQVTDGGVMRNGHRPRCGFLLATEDFKQG